MKTLFYLEQRSETKRKGWIQHDVYSVGTGCSLSDK